MASREYFTRPLARRQAQPLREKRSIEIIGEDGAIHTGRVIATHPAKGSPDRRGPHRRYLVATARRLKPHG